MGWVVAHKTLLSSPVPIGIGIWAGLGLDNRYGGGLSDDNRKIDITKELIACNFLFPIKVMVCVIRSLGVTRHDCRVGDIMLLLYQNMISSGKQSVIISVRLLIHFVAGMRQYLHFL